MAHAVVAYPEFEPSAEWIAPFLRAHDDLLVGAVEPHFTLVFPAEDVDPQALIAHTMQVLGRARAITFVLRTTRVVDDAFNAFWHVFLFPDEGATEIEALHDELYGGFLQPHLRRDIPFVPHVAVGSSLDHGTALALAVEIAAERLPVQGRVATLDVVAFGGKEADTIARITLRE
jgi:2'-5' RNA ligase